MGNTIERLGRACTCDDPADRKKSEKNEVANNEKETKQMRERIEKLESALRKQVKIKRRLSNALCSADDVIRSVNSSPRSSINGTIDDFKSEPSTPTKSTLFGSLGFSIGNNGLSSTRTSRSNSLASLSLPSVISRKTTDSVALMSSSSLKNSATHDGRYRAVTPPRSPTPVIGSTNFSDQTSTRSSRSNSLASSLPSMTSKNTNQSSEKIIQNMFNFGPRNRSHDSLRDKRK